MNICNSMWHLFGQTNFNLAFVVIFISSFSIWLQFRADDFQIPQHRKALSVVRYKLTLQMKKLFTIFILFSLISSQAKCQEKTYKDSLERVKVLKWFNDYSQNLRLQEQKVQDTISINRTSYKNSYSCISSAAINDKQLLLTAGTLYQTAESIFKYFETFKKTSPGLGSTATVALWVDLEKVCSDPVFKNYLTTICNYSDLLITDSTTKIVADDALSFFKLIPYKRNWYKYFNWGWLELARPDIEKRVSKVVALLFDQIKRKVCVTTAYNMGFCASRA